MQVFFYMIKIIKQKGVNDLHKDWLNDFLGEIKSPDGAYFFKQASAENMKEVYRYLKKTYPPETLEWVDDANWKKVKVPLSEIQMDRRPGGARETDKVKAIAKAFKDNEKMEPVVLVETPTGKLKVADGYHRTLGCKHAEKATIEAWVGKVEESNGPWDKEMHEKKLNKGPIPKAASEQGDLEKIAFLPTLGRIGMKAVKSVGNSAKNYAKGMTGSGVKAAKSNLSDVKANPISTRQDVSGAKKELFGERVNRAKAFGTTGLVGTAVGVNALDKSLKEQQQQVHEQQPPLNNRFL